MSIKAINWACDTDTPPTARYVLVILSKFADENLVAWPKLKYPLKKTGLSRQSVIDQIKYLEKNNFIKKISGTKRASNSYQLLMATSQPDLLPLRSQPDLLVNVVDQGSQLALLGVVNVVDQGSQRPGLNSKDIDHKERKNKDINGHAAMATSFSSSFEDFWKKYPKKVKKQKAWKIWVSLKADRLLPNILEDLDKRKWNGDKYTPHPSTYLNDRRWEDEISTRPAWEPEFLRMLAEEEEAKKFKGERH